MVLFMTDGESSNTKRLKGIIEGWSKLPTELGIQKPTVLTFAFGAGAKMDALNTIAQLSEGEASTLLRAARRLERDLTCVLAGCGALTWRFGA